MQEKMTTNMAEPVKKLDYIDALRGIAVLMVLFVHTLNLLDTQSLNNLFKTIAEQGRMGVQLFYMASAFTLFHSISQRSKTSESFSGLEFYLRRFFRIAPMFYVAIIYYFWQYITFPAPGMEAANLSTFTFYNLIAHFSFLHGLSPYWINTIVPGGWSVGVEMLFYLLVPTFYFTYKKYGVKFLYYALGISVLISWIINFILYTNIVSKVTDFWHAFMYYNIFNQLPVFILGMLMYDFIIKEKKSLKLVNLIFVTSIILFVFSLYLNKLTMVGIFGGSLLLLSVLLAYFIIFLSRYKLKVFVNRFFIYIGKISYSMYLVHFAFLSLLSFLFKDYITVSVDNLGAEITFIFCFILLVVCTGAASSLTYRYIEKPFIIMGNKLIERLSKK